MKIHYNKKRLKRKTKIVVTNFIQKFSPTNNDLQEHVMSLSIEDIRSINTLRHDDFDLSE